MKQPKVSKLLNSDLAVKCAHFPAFILSLFLLSGAAQAANSSSQKLVYEVYAGGVHAVQARLAIDIDEDNKRYDIVLDTETHGLLGKIVPWEGTFESHGWIMPSGEFRPEHHQSTTGWQDDMDIKDYRYNKDGTFKSLRITDDHSKAELREIAKDITDHTTDTLSATLNVLENYNHTGTCEGESEVFDGKRRFKQSFKNQKAEQLSPNKYNIADGLAAVCTVEVTPISGEWHEKPRGWMSVQEQGRARGTMPTVWIGKLSDNGPAVPLKIRVKTAYGTLFMHLAEFQNGEKSLIAEKRVKEKE